MIKKILIISLGLLIAFICGMEYENSAAKNRFEIVGAMLITTTAYDNFIFQRNLYNEMQQDILAGDLDKLKNVLSKHLEHMDYMIKNAESFCDREECTDEDREYLNESFLRSQVINKSDK